MGKRGNSNIGTIALVALFAFVAGKLSSEDPKRGADETPRAFVSQTPASYDSGASYAEPEPFAPQPQRFVSEEPQRAYGSRPFRNCREARAAGAAPVRIGDPGYAPRLDRDGDGIGCE